MKISKILADVFRGRPKQASDRNKQEFAGKFGDPETLRKRRKIHEFYI